MTASRTKVLCVDDEPNVLEGLTLNLRRRFDVSTALGGPAGLEAMQRDGAPAVVISDMRMPGMSGAAFLAKVRELAPDTVRILLTGQADMDSAIAAVNEGQIFRFLTKPCPPPVLLGAIEAAIEQHRLITAERVLLEQTLHGCIKTLVDVLALTNPVSFGRATRIKQHVSDLAEKLGLLGRWQVEVAAMLSQLGYVTLPAEVAEKVHQGHPLTQEEQAMVARTPAVTEQLLGNIPRLEVVRGILASYAKSTRPEKDSGDGDKRLISLGAQMLRIATDFDTLEARGCSAALAVTTMRGREGQYDPIVLNALGELRGGEGARTEVEELPLSALCVGMVLADDVKMVAGTLLVARGYVITESFIERLRNYRADSVVQPVLVIVPASRGRGRA